MPLSVKDDAAIEEYFATAQTGPDADFESMDPADRLTFVRPSREGVTAFDTRSERDLRSAILSHPDPVERERAAWTYGHRLREEALPILTDLVGSDPCRELRCGALWLIQKVGAVAAGQILSTFEQDKDDEVADWASLLRREITGACDAKANRPACFDPSNPFDQTLPLLIAGFARVKAPTGWIEVTLSPMWFEQILGRVMACTCEHSFDSDLVIEKRLSRYHADGTDHFEIFKFRGFTFHPAPSITEHVYESQSCHTFYPSGKVEDTSAPAIGDVPVVLNRKATPIVVPPRMPVSPRSPSRPNIWRAQAPERIVESVRGRFMGTAYINLARILANNFRVGAGEVQLSSLHHPVTGPLTNTFLFGTFKGKLSDLDGDGILDINSEPAHATRDGALDYRLTGAPNSDPFDPFGKV